MGATLGEPLFSSLLGSALPAIISMQASVEQSCCEGLARSSFSPCSQLVEVTRHAGQAAAHRPERRQAQASAALELWSRGSGWLTNKHKEGICHFVTSISLSAAWPHGYALTMQSSCAHPAMKIPASSISASVANTSLIMAMASFRPM